jgi:hydroxymethylpyrimidine pyrophosphatase-like HAD family hydrolase
LRRTHRTPARTTATSRRSASWPSSRSGGWPHRRGRRRAEPDDEARGLRIYNLVTDFGRTSALLTERIEALPEPPGRAHPDERLTIFLLLAALHQAVEDHLHRTPGPLDRTAARFGSFRHPAAGAVARLARALADALASIRSRGAAERTVVRFAVQLAAALDDAARAALYEDDADALRRVSRSWGSLRAAAERLPEALRASFPSLPNPFATFDQLPDDLHELARRFAARWPDHERQILLVGIRTSGTYLAALQRAILRREGYQRVDLLTLRPGSRWRRAEAAAVRAVSDAGGLVLIVDDPPTTGSTVARAARECVERGAAHESIVLVLQLLGPPESLPERLQSFACVLLPWSEWAIQERLSPARVRAALERLLVGRELRPPGGRVRAVEGVERLDAGARGGRRHARARYRVRLLDEHGERFEQHVHVQGTGLGHFADYPRAVATELAEFLPELYGVEDGLLYRAWLPEAGRSGSAPEPERIAAYVLARRRRLPVDPALAARAVDDKVSWDLVADMLGWALAHSLRMLVFPLTWAAARRLTSLDRPALVDGAMDASNWFVPSATDVGLKLAPAEAAFANAAKLSYDWAFDLASAGASFDVEELLTGEPGTVEAPFSQRLLEAFAELSGERIDRERWLVYQLLHNRWERSQLRERGPRDGDAGAHARRLIATERALAAAERRYVADLFLGDLAPPTSGRLCAIDVDWTLETRWLDFPALMPTGALALRALIRHGFRPVIATGRSLGEVRLRCAALRLAGGVAEYGGAVYDHGSGRVLPALAPPDEDALARLRERLGRLPGVVLDDWHRHSVRALRLTDAGEPRGLDDETVDAALADQRLEGRLRVIYGGLQTDFAAASVTKGTGARLLARTLDAERAAEPPLAFAIGDDLPDAELLELAASPYAPGNASDALRERLGAGVQVVAGRQGAGLLEAVRSFLGHDPRRCSTCAPPAPSERARLLVGPLLATDGPRRERLRQAAALAAVLARARR